MQLPEVTCVDELVVVVVPGPTVVPPPPPPLVVVDGVLVGPWVVESPK